MAGQRIGDFLVTRAIGAGGMGRVFEAIHAENGQRVAIKVLHPERARDPHLLQRFRNEALAARAIRHPGLVEIYDFGALPDRTAYLVMEYLEGEPLSRRLQAKGRLRGAALWIGAQVAEALAAAHAAGVVHRDLKPDNVMLVPDADQPGGERAKIFDFSIAKQRGPGPAGAAGADRLTPDGAVLGTPRFMAPEQCRFAGDVTDRADVYSLGVILYLMLSGRPPFLGSGQWELVTAHLSAVPRPLALLMPGIAPTLAELVGTMLAKLPTERPGMTEVAAVLRGLAANPEVVATTEVALAAVHTGTIPLPEFLRTTSKQQAQRRPDLAAHWRRLRQHLSRPIKKLGRLGMALAAGLLLVGVAAGLWHTQSQATVAQPSSPPAPARLVRRPARPPSAPGEALQREATDAASETPTLAPKEAELQEAKLQKVTRKRLRRHAQPRKPRSAIQPD